MAEFPHNLRCGGGWAPRPHHAYVVDPAHRSDPSGLVDRTNHLVATIPHPHRPSLLFEGFIPGVPRFGPVGSAKLAQSKALGFTHDNNNNKKVSEIQQGPGPVRFTAVRFNPVRSTGSGRECGGTGVFLPRVAVNPEVNKKSHVNKGEKQQKKQQKYGVVAKETVPIQPPELLLPQEWTY